MNLVSNKTRKASVNAIVNAEPTVGPRKVYMPPAIEAYNICRETGDPPLGWGVRTKFGQSPKYKEFFLL